MPKLWGRWQARARLKSRFKFFGDIITELRKVIWPSRSELLRLTLLVLAVCIVVAVILGVMDFGFGRLIRIILLAGSQ